MPTMGKKTRPKWLPERKPFERRKVDNQKFYNSAKWRKTSKAYRAANPLCECDECKDKWTPAEEVDHIVAIESGGAKYDWDNLQSLSKACHAKKSATERKNTNGKGGEIV